MRKTGSAGPSCRSSPQRSCPMLTLQLAEEVLTHSVSMVFLSPRLWGAAKDAWHPAPTNPRPSPGGPLHQAVLVEFEREVLVTGAAIREGEIIAGGHKGSLRGVHPDAV